MTRAAQGGTTYIFRALDTGEGTTQFRTIESRSIDKMRYQRSILLLRSDLDDAIAQQASSSPYVDFRSAGTTKVEIDMAGIGEVRTDIRNLQNLIHEELRDHRIETTAALQAQRTDMREDFKAFSTEFNGAIERLINELKAETAKSTEKIVAIREELVRIDTTIKVGGTVAVAIITIAIAVLGLLLHFT